MSNTLKSRIEALEKASDDAFRVVVMEYGETEAQAFVRAGLPPDYNGNAVMLIRFGPLTEIIRGRM